MEGEMVDQRTLAALTARFYDRASADPLLGPVIAAALPPERMVEHHAVFAAFWVRVLGGEADYRGNPFLAHAGLSLGAEHFKRWLEIFAAVATEILPAEPAARVLAQARHMSECLQGRPAAPGEAGEVKRVAWPLGRAARPSGDGRAASHGGCDGP